MNTPRTLLLLVSRQVWPNIISTVYFKPERVILLHSSEAAVSRQPAERLRHLLAKAGLASGDRCQLLAIPDDNYHGIHAALDTLPAEQLRDAALGFNAGSKLMAVACFDWAQKQRLQAFYLETDGELQRFDFSNGTTLTSTERPDPAICDFLAPLDLIRCQLHSSEVLHEGQTITLNDPGICQLTDAQFKSSMFSVSRDQPRCWLSAPGGIPKPAKEGDLLELAVAATLLRLGVKQVVRGVELIPAGAKGADRKTHAELDIVFNHAGRLWIVECKDRKRPKTPYNFQGRTLKEFKSALNSVWSRLFDESQAKIVKEHLISTRDVGGSLGKLIFLCQHKPDSWFLRLATSLGVGVVWKEDMLRGFRSLLAAPEATPVTVIKHL